MSLTLIQTYLRRHLTPDELEEVRAYEPCIVDKQHKYLVITDKHLCLTANPPKPPKGEVLEKRVAIENIATVRQVADMPDFLARNDQKRCVHIQVAYRVNSEEGANQKRPSIVDDNDPNEWSLSLPESDMHKQLEEVKALNRDRSKSETLDSTVTQQLNSKQQSVRFRLPFGKQNKLTTEVRLRNMDIYILNPSTSILRVMKSCLEDFKISSILAEDGPLNPSSSSTQSAARANERFFNLYKQLEGDIELCSHDKVALIDLISELNRATKKYKALKNFFWKNGILYPILIEKLSAYLPHSPSDLSKEDEVATRFDELELVVVMADCLMLNLRGSETIPERDPVLKMGRCSKTAQLLRLMICTPEVPRVAAVKLNDEQIAKLVEIIENFYRKSVQVIWELFMIGKKARYEDECNLSVSWMLEILISSGYLDEFLNRLISLVLETVRSDGDIVPSDLMILYQSLTVINSIIEYRPTVVTRIRESFEVDVRYFLDQRQFKDKFLREDEVTAEVIDGLENLRKQVLGNANQRKP